MEYDLTILEQKLTESSDDIQELVSSPETLAAVESIAQKHGVNEDGGLALIDIVTHTLLGLLDPKDIVSRVSADLGVEKGAAKTIAEELYKELFSLVEASLSSRYTLTQTLFATMFPSDTTGVPTFPAMPAAPKPPITVQTPPPAPTTPVPQTPAQMPPTNMFEEKLKRVFTVPREESRVASTPTTPNALTPPTAPRSAGSDPYRESLH
ncbi:MAG: hypothetical protein A2408_03645 [Candidatus Yonathbacteria bacterium RIFOXYC1_FULL_52_10]|uniref:Uncharacterized protein n=1 Tax=Candidatus Yonathbacteria bacterium RIFOXYD1_FULL_52_36 TaxID=1802730 RepID=A0A1G2SJ28_9BACT|nr:MAG: hypothetical protein A2591_02805 [Candidatus Yonathbacteria bacterium RIFOXYD1_FULL_52_36]OHA85277.1 MAG: hypothetical protein A2408_03645 [Candidatus Yonathbacteria bacterium RIFOXYC1_FULL_52_10]